MGTESETRECTCIEVYRGSDERAALWEHVPTCPVHADDVVALARMIDDDRHEMRKDAQSDLAAARAEVARLREAVERVRVLTDEPGSDFPYVQQKALRAALAPVVPSGEAESGERVEGCWCYACDAAAPGFMFRTRMNLCPDCGNKRCPRASDHRNACSGSNEVGQPGSIYGPAPVPSGGQADGEGETGHRWPCTRFYVTAPATDRCTCGQADGEGEVAAALREAGLPDSASLDDLIAHHRGNAALVAVIEARLAARPVLSREALVKVLTEHRYLCHSARGVSPRWEQCSCGEKFIGTEPWRMLARHQADVLTAGGE